MIIATASRGRPARALGDVVTDQLVEAAKQQISRIAVSSAYGPDIVIDDPFSPGPPNAYLQALKPKVVFFVGDQQVSSAPWGDPPPTKWPAIVTGAKVAGIGLALAALLGARRYKLVRR